MTDEEITEILKNKKFPAMMAEAKATEVFDHHIQTVAQDRGKDYGSPLENFKRIAAGWEIIAECEDPEIRVALMLGWVKTSRLIGNPTHLDSHIDVAGYARTACMVIDERQDDGR